MTCEITIAGVTLDHDRAKAEAVATLQLAALSVGGELAVSDVTTTLKRYYPSTGAIGEPARGDEG